LQIAAIPLLDLEHIKQERVSNGPIIINDTTAGSGIDTAGSPIVLSAIARVASALQEEARSRTPTSGEDGTEGTGSAASHFLYLARFGKVTRSFEQVSLSII
jgi:hypothetical protein